MLVNVLAIVAQQATRTPSDPVEHQPSQFLYLLPLLPVVAVVTVALFLRHRGDDGWTVTPISTMLIPTTAVLVEFANVLFITGTNRLLPALADNGWSVLAGALVLGTTTVLGGAVKQRRFRYIAISASASAIALLVIITRADNPIIPFLLLVLGLYVLIGGVLGYTTASTTRSRR